MNLFRSEEHVRRWADFNADSMDGIKPVREMAKVFSNPLFTERLNENYVRRIEERIPGLLADLDRFGGRLSLLADASAGGVNLGARRGRGGTFQPRAPSHTQPHSGNLLSVPPSKRPKCHLQELTRHFTGQT